MNKNEKQQLNFLREVIKSPRFNYIEWNVMRDAYEIDTTHEPYDVKISCKDKEIYAQVTTMSNLVVTQKGKITDGTKYKPPLPVPGKDSKKNEENLKKKNIDRKVSVNRKDSLMIRDKYSNYGPDEENYDQKYNIETSGLLNALIRSLKNKLNKYDLKDKKDNSTLIVIDNSRNFFYHKQIRNFRGYTDNKLIKEIKEYSKRDFLDLLLHIAILETKDNAFFDNIQVFFKESINEKPELFYIASSMKENKYPLNHRAHCQFMIMSANNVSRIFVKDSND